MRLPPSFAAAAPSRGVAAWAVFYAAVALACSTEFRPKACDDDRDCGEGAVCVAEAPPVCRRAFEVPLRVGMSAPLSGPSQGLGLEMKKGVGLAFEEQNDAGGVRGRRLELVLRDDQYIPQQAEAAVRELLDVREVESEPRCPTTDKPLIAGERAVASRGLERGPGSVFAILGNVGTPTMVRTAPIAVETKTLFFGPFTGAARMLRDGAAGDCARYIFNVRASYAQEARATVEFFRTLRVPDTAHFVSFDQNDSFGQAGYDGLLAALSAVGVPYVTPAGAGPEEPVKRLRYARDDDASVPAQVAAASAYFEGLLADGGEHTVGVFMTDTYGPATSFIRGVRDWHYGEGSGGAAGRGGRLRVFFSNVSFVGPDELAQRLQAAGSVATPAGPRPYADGVFVSQVVPNYRTDGSDAVRAYRAALGRRGLSPSFTSLEGYLAARVFVAGLEAAGGATDPEALVEAFETMPSLALGLGAGARFDRDRHHYSRSVWGTAVGADGTFSDRYVWTDGTPLQLFE